MTQPAHPSLLEVAQNMRRIHVQMLESSKGDTDTAGTCLPASILLCQAVSQFCGCTAQVCGGGPDIESGFFSGYFDGKDWLGHFWVVACDAQGAQWLLDITADQFGAEPVLVLPLAQVRGRYVPGSAEKAQAQIQAWCERAGIPVPA